MTNERQRSWRNERLADSVLTSTVDEQGSNCIYLEQTVVGEPLRTISTIQLGLSPATDAEALANPRHEECTD